MNNLMLKHRQQLLFFNQFLIKTTEKAPAPGAGIFFVQA